ncbi:MAG: hypothetical protein V1809_06540 [Planctomycetota bacterium]
MLVRYVHLPKKSLPCLKCGKFFLTDRHHRFCRRCKDENEKLGAVGGLVRMSRELSGARA